MSKHKPGALDRVDDGSNRVSLSVRKGDLSLIRRLAAEGARESAIAKALSLSPSGWTRLKQRDPRAAEAYQAGRDDLERECIAYLRNPTLPDDPELSISERIAVMKARVLGYQTIGNARLGWRLDAQPEAGKVNVTISLPSPAASVSDYQARIVADVKPEATDD